MGMTKIEDFAGGSGLTDEERKAGTVGLLMYLSLGMAMNGVHLPTMDAENADRLLLEIKLPTGEYSMTVETLFGMLDDFGLLEAHQIIHQADGFGV